VIALLQRDKLSDCAGARARSYACRR
jgi:hypothetical protein